MLKYDQVTTSYLAKLDHKLVAYHLPTNLFHLFLAQKQAFESIPAGPFVVQLIGSCKEFYVTEYLHGFSTVSSEHYVQLSTLKRMNLCLNFAGVLNHLHGNNLALSSTHQDDVDTISSKLLIGPESLVLGPSAVTFDDNSTMIKHDILLAPELCNNFLGDERIIKDRLKSVHRLCRDKFAHLRPDSSTLLRSYRLSFQEFMSTKI